jgi:hypothetical protein
MRLILRRLRLQDKLEGRSPLGWDDDDYAVVCDGPCIGRIYAEKAGPLKGKWKWFLQIVAPGVNAGVADSLEAAKAALESRWREIKQSGRD